MPRAAPKATAANKTAVVRSHAPAEREADRAADHAVPPGTRLDGAGSARLRPGLRDQPLSGAEQAWFGPRLGHDFGGVRVHADSQAAGMADALGAEAFTLGRDIYFGSGSLAPGKGDGDRLLAHELAHVKQQSRSGPSLQPKLKITGDAANVARAQALLNSGLRGYRVSISDAGVVTITPNFVELPPDAQQQALADNLTTVIDDPKQVAMTVSDGTPTLGGSFATGDFDIGDLETYGVPGLIHEIVEQYEKQTKGAGFGNDTSGAHSTAIAAESAVRGQQRGAQHMVSKSSNADGTIDAVVEIPHTAADGTVTTMVMTISHNDIISVTWR